MVDSPFNIFMLFVSLELASGVSDYKMYTQTKASFCVLAEIDINPIFVNRVAVEAGIDERHLLRIAIDEAQRRSAWARVLQPCREMDSAVVRRVLAWTGACVGLLQQQHGQDG